MGWGLVFYPSRPSTFTDSGCLFFSAAPYRRIPIAAGNFDAVSSSELWGGETVLRILIYAPKPNMHSRDSYMPHNYARWPLSIFCIMKIQGPGSKPQP
ncbi:hypothetical protein TNCV_2221021 [Trichonephila clavipes]|nr:hypothetical protein TNCV_2221021 [Trichonephila clavipes]